jgi:hypothetical protein
VPYFTNLTWGLRNMLPAQRSNLSSYLRWFNLSAAVSGFQAWVRQEIVDDDPWDVETLHPSSSILPLGESDLSESDLSEPHLEEPNPKESIF